MKIVRKWEINLQYERISRVKGGTIEYSDSTCVYLLFTVFREKKYTRSHPSISSALKLLNRPHLFLHFNTQKCCVHIFHLIKFLILHQAFDISKLSVCPVPDCFFAFTLAPN